MHLAKKGLADCVYIYIRAVKLLQILIELITGFFGLITYYRYSRYIFVRTIN